MDVYMIYGKLHMESHGWVPQISSGMKVVYQAIKGGGDVWSASSIAKATRSSSYLPLALVIVTTIMMKIRTKIKSAVVLVTNESKSCFPVGYLYIYMCIYIYIYILL